MTPHDWISTGLTATIFLLGLALIPMLRNLVNSRLEEIEDRFNGLEEKAHAAILSAIHDIQQSFHAHNADAHAHANLASFAKLEVKIEEVRTEIIALRVCLAEAAAVQSKRRTGGRR